MVKLIEDVDNFKKDTPDFKILKDSKYLIPAIVISVLWIVIMALIFYYCKKQPVEAASQPLRMWFRQQQGSLRVQRDSSSNDI